MIDPILSAAITEYRSQMHKAATERPRTSTYYMFNTIRVDENFNVFHNGPRIGFNAETLARLLVLFPQWDSAEQVLRLSGLKSHARLMPVVIGTDEIVFDEDSQMTYATQIRIEFERGITIPMRDAATGSQMRSNGGVTAHEMLRSSIEDWRTAEQITVDRRVSSGQAAQTKEINH